MHTLSIIQKRQQSWITWIIGSNKNLLQRKAPEGWHEMDREKLLAYLQYLHKYQKDNDFLRIKVFQLLYGLKYHHFKYFEADQLHTLQKKIQWIFSEPLTVQLIPTIHYFTTRLYGPGDNLKGYTGYEFIYSDMYFMQYQSSKDESHLNKFIACLYRKPKPNAELKSESYDGDYRIAFNPNTIDRRLKIVKKQSSLIKLAILMYYTGCRQQWEKLHPNLFSSESQGEAKSQGWDKIMLKISGKEFGNFDATLGQPVHNIFRKMDADIEEYSKNKNN